jgi:hypothetical protein
VPKIPSKNRKRIVPNPFPRGNQLAKGKGRPKGSRTFLRDFRKLVESVASPEDIKDGVLKIVEGYKTGENKYLQIMQDLYFEKPKEDPQTPQQSKEEIKAALAEHLRQLSPLIIEAAKEAGVEIVPLPQVAAAPVENPPAPSAQPAEGVC